jgi:hypothetical protein
MIGGNILRQHHLKQNDVDGGLKVQRKQPMKKCHVQLRKQPLCFYTAKRASSAGTMGQTAT